MASLPETLDRIALPPGEGEALRKLAAGLRASLGNRLLRLRLFGSKATGEWHQESDTDVLVLVDRRDRGLEDRVFAVCCNIDLEHGTVLSPLILDRSRYAELAGRELMLIRDIESKGIEL